MSVSPNPDTVNVTYDASGDMIVTIDGVAVSLSSSFSLHPLHRPLIFSPTVAVQCR